MRELSNELLMEIGSIQWLNADQLRSKYMNLLYDCAECHREDFLRSTVIYRLQEQFYGTCLDEKTAAVLDKAVEGEFFKHAPADEVKRARQGRKVVRNYKGVDYEAILRPDGRVEVGGKLYRSLTSAATAITGTHWNGRTFFGLN